MMSLLVVWRASTHQYRQPPSYLSITDSAASPDTLSFPLTAALERLRRNSRFNIVPILLVSSALAFLATISAYTLETRIMNGSGILMVTGLIYCCMTYENMRQAKMLLQLYEWTEAPVLTLDAKGMSVPLLLLSDADKNRKTLLAAGKTSVEILWQDIVAWNVSRRPDSCFRLKTRMGVVVPKSDTFCISRDISRTYSNVRSLSNREEQNLLDFAQCYLRVPIEIDGF